MTSDAQYCEVIAEVAQGYEGSPVLIDKFVSAFLFTNADAIKFQLIYADEMATADYKWYKLFQSLETDIAHWKAAVDKVHSAGKKIYFDVYGDLSYSVAKDCNADGVKISTTEFYNENLISKSINNFRTVLVSTGGIPVDDLKEVSSKYLDTAKGTVILLHGFQSEPTPPDRNNLHKIALLKDLFPKFKIGFMDHTDGSTDMAIDIPILALGAGMQVLEKHLTLDRALELEDFVSGITPLELKVLVSKLRRYQNVLGSKTLQVQPYEEEYFRKAVKVAVAASDLAAGTTLTSNHINFKRVSADVTSSNIFKLKDMLNFTINKNIKKDVPINVEDLCED